MKPSIIFISSVQPSPTTGGEVVLYRHLNRLKDWDVSVVTVPPSHEVPGTLSKLYHRLQSTRLHIWLKDLEVLLKGYQWSGSLSQIQDCSQRAVVLTVAHGDGCWAAQRFAEHHQLPLVTIFHDWLPDSITVHNSMKSVLERRFQQLYQSSAAALCVSDGMKKQLGEHPNSSVLYPIPASAAQKHLFYDTENAKETFLVAYSGGLYDYGPMLADLLNVTKNHADIKFQVRGKNPNWSLSFQTEMRKQNLWLDFAPREILEKWFDSVDALLVTMSFDPTLRRRMQTSFPSKLIEYAQFGKPIIIWGPSDCAAVVWARHKDCALVVTDPDPLAVLSVMEQLRCSQKMRRQYAIASHSSAIQEFDPTVIQQQFTEELLAVLAF